MALPPSLWPGDRLPDQPFPSPYGRVFYTYPARNLNNTLPPDQPCCSGLEERLRPQTTAERSSQRKKNPSA